MSKKFSFSHSADFIEDRSSDVLMGWISSYTEQNFILIDLQLLFIGQCIFLFIGHCIFQHDSCSYWKKY